jgi:response regulator RpfG family c-di-GMP phosphodiesterase
MNASANFSLLIVDDEEAILNSLKRLLKNEGFAPMTASSGAEGLRLLKSAEAPVALIISDQRMPEMTGSQFLEQAKQISPASIRFLLTGYSDMDALVDAVNRGEIHRYITKPWNDDELLAQVRQACEQFELVAENRRLTELTRKQNAELQELNRNLEKKVDERTQEIQEKNDALEKSFMDTFRLLSSLTEMLNPRLGEYMKHVGYLAREVALAFGLAKDEVDQIEIAGMFHDVGLLGLPAALLLKDEAEMDTTEFGLYTQHPEIAALGFESVQRLAGVSKIILAHHESYDGDGYPNGLKADKIPLGARIVAAVSDYCRIVDTWPVDVTEIIKRVTQRVDGALAESLPAEDADSLLAEAADKILEHDAGHRYDPDVVAKLKEQIAREQSRPRGKQWVAAADLKAGMVLEESLRLKDGRPLLSKGVQLTESSIKILSKIMGLKMLEDRFCVSGH